MNLDEYRAVFAICSIILMLVAAIPALNLTERFPREMERFSEFWILSGNHTTEDFPLDVCVNKLDNDSYPRVFVGVGNHMGYLSYYLVYAKFRNQTQPLPNSTASEPSPLPPLYEFQFFVEDGEIWESPLAFTILNAHVRNNTMFIDEILINSVAFSVNSSSTWDSKNNGFYYQLFFELWHYNVSSESFQYTNCFVGIRLNVHL